MLTATFATLDALRREKLHGRSPEGRWTMRRYEIDLHSNSLGSWTATIRDWKGIGPTGTGGLGIGIDPDPDAALRAAMQQLEIIP